MAEDEFGNVIGGKLSFKGSGALKEKKKKKKKRKRDKNGEGGEKRSKERKEDHSKQEEEEEIIETKGLTECQRKHALYKSKTEAKILEKIASKTYRERVEEFNENLSNLSEHHDVPKISAAGNG